LIHLELDGASVRLVRESPGWLPAPGCRIAFITVKHTPALTETRRLFLFVPDLGIAFGRTCVHGRVTPLIYSAKVDGLLLTRMATMIHSATVLCIFATLPAGRSGTSRSLASENRELKNKTNQNKNSAVQNKKAEAFVGRFSQCQD
jgi:hypothetical protein